MMQLIETVDVSWVGIYEDTLLGSCMWNVGVRNDWNTV